jgi:Cell division protein CrgA
VPKSRVRKTEVFTPPPTRSAKKRVSPRWVAPTMVTLMILGVLWLVAGYISNYAFPGMDVLGGQAGNLAEGFVLLVLGLGLATQWR